MRSEPAMSMCVPGPGAQPNPIKSSGISTNKKIGFTAGSGSAGQHSGLGEQGMQSANWAQGAAKQPLHGAPAPAWGPQGSAGSAGAPPPHQPQDPQWGRRAGGAASGKQASCPAGRSQSCPSAGWGPAPRARGRGGQRQLAPLSRKRQPRGRAWEPTPANPALSSSAILSLD